MPNYQPFLVEARGIEPLSENLFIQLSPDAVRHLEFLSPDAGEQASVRVAIFCVIPSIANGGCTVIAELTPGRRPRYSCGGRAAQRQRQQPLGCQSNVRVVVCFLGCDSFKRLSQRYPLTVCQNPRRNHYAPILDGETHRRENPRFGMITVLLFLPRLTRTPKCRRSSSP